MDASKQCFLPKSVTKHILEEVFLV